MLGYPEFEYVRIPTRNPARLSGDESNKIFLNNNKKYRSRTNMTEQNFHRFGGASRYVLGRGTGQDCQCLHGPGDAAASQGRAGHGQDHACPLPLPRGLEMPLLILNVKST